MIRPLLLLVMTVVVAAWLTDAVVPQEPSINDITQEVPCGFLLSEPKRLLLQRGVWTLNIVMRDDNYAELASLHQQLQATAKRIEDEYLQLMPNCNDRQRVACIDGYAHRSITATLKLLGEPLEEMSGLAPRSRRRRGVINGVGEFSKWAFGTATQEDINKVTTLVTQARAQQQKLFHVMNAMHSVLDNVVTEHDRDHDRIRLMWNTIESLTARTEQLFKLMEIDDKRRALQQAIEYMITIRGELIRVALKHQQVLQDLQNHRVTQAILPLQTYSEIASKIRRKGYVPMAWTWLFKYGMTKFMFETQGQLFYQMEFPCVDTSEYLFYTLDTWPTFVGDDNDTLYKLDVTNHFAMATQTSDILQPYECRGQDPIVCSTTPIFSRGQYQCERGIVNKHFADRANCKLQPTLTPSSSWIKRYESRWILMAIDETITLRCTRQVETKKQLRNGLYAVTVPGHCTLTGQDWVLYGEIHDETDYNATVSTTDLRVDQLRELVPLQRRTRIEHLPDWDDVRSNRTHPLLEKIKNDLDTIKDDNDLYDMHAHVNYGQSGLIIVLVLLVIVFLSFACYKRKKLVYLFGPLCHKKKVVNPSIEQVVDKDTSLTEVPATT